MNDILLAALTSCFSKMAKAAGPIQPGLHQVDETITMRVKGEVLKSDDETYVPTIAIPVKAVMATLLPRLGATREAAMETLIAAMTEAVNLDKLGDETLKARMKDVDAAFEHVQNVLDALPPKTRTGKTNVDVTLVVAPTAAVALVP
jgi:hypothetical protein